MPAVPLSIAALVIGVIQKSGPELESWANALTNRSTPIVCHGSGSKRSVSGWNDAHANQKVWTM